MGCASWRRNAQCFTLPEDPEVKCLWFEFVAESDDQRSEIVICSEHFLEESFEKSAVTNRVRLKPSAVPTVRIKTEVSGFGDSPQKRSCQQIDKIHLSKISSPSNQECEDANKAAEGGTSAEDPFPTETLVVVIKEENIKTESEESFVIQGEAAISNDASSSTCLLRKDRHEETVSEESSEEGTDEDLNKDSHRDSQRPKHGPYKYYRSVKQLCDDCGCFYNPKKSHTCEYKVKPYACNMCGKRCRTKISLKSHSHIHDNNKIHNCKYCYAPFGSKQDKINHQETHKDELNPFKCHSCPATFNCFLTRKKHLGTHKRGREHKCEKCGTIFMKKHVLERHMMIHSGEKAFKCSVCDRGFNQLGNMKSHMRLHTGEKPYKCQCCDQAFNHNVSLKSHMQRYHSNNRLPKTEEVCSVNNLVNGPHTADEVKEVQAEVLSLNKWSTGRPKGRPKKNNKAFPKSRRKVNKSLQKRHQSAEQNQEVSNSDWSSDWNEEVEKMEQERIKE